MRRLEAVLAFVVCASAALPLIACDQSADELSNTSGKKTTKKTNPDGTPATGEDDSTAATDGPASVPGSAAAKATAMTLFTALKPKLEQNCGPCHVMGSAGAPVWLGGPDPYATIKGYAGILTDNPDTSILITKPAHTGPALPADLVPEVKAWLTAEGTAAAATPATGVSSVAVAIPTGATSLDLPTPGGKVTFTSSFANGILTLKTVTLVAPADTGIHATGFHLVLIHAAGGTSSDDALSGVDANIAKATTATLGVGLVVIPKVAMDDKFQIQVDTLVTSTGTTAVAVVGGCKDVTSFTTNAAPALKNNTCLNCHNTGGSGNGALDLSALALATPDFAKACGQAKSKIDTTNVAQSPIIVAPTGGQAAHPFKNAPATYTTAMTIWINAEK